MSSIPASSSPCELCFTFPLGAVVRESGKSRHVSLDAVARDHGQRAVDRMLETPGQWIGVESAPDLPAACANAHEVVSRPIGMGNPKLPDIHPGTPPTCTVRVEVHVLKDTAKASLVELPGNPVPSRTMWLPRSVVGIGGLGSSHFCKVFFVPPWLYRRMQKSL